MCIFEVTSYYILKLGFIENGPVPKWRDIYALRSRPRKQGKTPYMKLYIFFQNDINNLFKSPQCFGYGGL